MRYDLAMFLPPERGIRAMFLLSTRSPIRLVILIAVFALQGCISIPPFGPSNDRGTLRLEVVEKADNFFTTDEILMVPMSGLVAQGSQETSMGGNVGMLVALRDRLDAARENSRIKAVVLRIDTPGGSVTASDLIYHEIVKFKEETELPVVAMLDGVAASGGVYVAMAADEIYALPTTVTGSIGVIGMYPNLSGLIQKIGVSMNVIKSGEMKDAGSPWRAMTDNERDYFQSMLGTYYDRFFGIVLDSRKKAGMTREMLEPQADGRILTPEQALEIRLIDGIGYYDAAFDRAKELAGISDASVVSYEYPFHYRGHVYARTDAAAPMAGPAQINLLNIDPEAVGHALSGARFCYLWLP
jgi:protease-4